MSRPSARSKYARRAAGAPLTTPRRSGVKTSVVSSARNCSTLRSGAPLSDACFGEPTSSLTSTPTRTSPRAPVTAMRAASAPNRTSCRSARGVAVEQLEPGAEEVGVEAALARSAGVTHGQRLPRLAHLVRTRHDRELAFREAQLQRRRALDHHRCAANDVEQLSSRKRQLVLERLG